MAPRKGLFKSHGSQDACPVEVKGDEWFRTIKYYTRKWVLIGGATFAIIAGVAPLMMSLIMGDLMNVMMSGQSFLDSVKT
jgi:preprotein translocase subunit SecY